MPVTQDHLLHYPHPERWQLAILSTALLLGALFNLLAIYVLYLSRIKCVLSKLLFYNQNVFDIIVCTAVLAQFATLYAHSDPRGHVTIVYCLLMESSFFMKFVRVLALANIICLSASRFLLIVCPKSYRQHGKRYIILCYVFIFSYALASSLPRTFAMHFHEGKCLLKTTALLRTSLIIFDVFVRYLFPLTVILTMYLITMRVVRKLQAEHSAKSADSVGLQCSDLNPYLSVWNCLSISTTGFAIELTILEVTALIMYTLQEFGLINFRVDSIGRMYYVYGCAVIAGLNPGLEIATIPALRKTTVQLFVDLTNFVGKAVGTFIPKRCAVTS
ncbi:hypothetical protein FBUS_03612 [Fasciolopsis buskii]|uniref:G-protein coupled receptors family 1 profile domain-containing protein n=1 Tax=Fasciolopsis buskii TaxID=27845 RepID=A0A8E0VKE4_9TREM|nr:hypothetical protein FBUS_03612 [Fasciolopsis buski]